MERMEKGKAHAKVIQGPLQREGNRMEGSPREHQMQRKSSTHINTISKYAPKCDTEIRSICCRELV